jgi:DNA-binding NarL/FixJ family response regulator
MKKKATNSISDAFIHIIGNNTLQNELLLSFLKNEIGIKGKCFPTLKSKGMVSKDESIRSKFFLIDCRGIDMKNCFKEIHRLKELNPPQCYVALCNADSKTDIGKIAMGNGIDGIFFDDEPPRMIPKGVVSILNGDLWYSRKSMTKFLLEPKNSVSSSENGHAKDLLTFREREVLTLIASGQNSRQISEKLFISSHTVKTHIYNIYNKINVTNRLQATLWAAKYL